MNDTYRKGDVYRISAMKGFLGGVSRELPDAVPPLLPSAPPISWGSDASQLIDSLSNPAEREGRLGVLKSLMNDALSSVDAASETGSAGVANEAQNLSSAAERRFGWVQGALPSPDSEGRYIVEFVGKRDVLILAYLDKFGRVFKTDAPLDSHPAREPDMKFSRYARQDDPKVLRGCVEVPADGSWREVARFVRLGERYTLYDSWYDFGENGRDLLYPDALARCYLAFVYRPSLGAPEVETRGLDGVEEPLDRMPALPALRKIESDIMHAQWDPALKPPALARALSRWLQQAGIDDLAFAPSGALRLVRTIRFADVFYVGATEEGQGLPPRRIWCLQNALNRYLLVKRVFGENASLTGLPDVLQAEERLIETVAQDFVRNVVPTLPAGDTEWDMRNRIALAVELLAAPLRVEVDFRADVRAGVVSFAALVPDADMMPLQRWDGLAHAVAEVQPAERAAQAQRYAQRIALLLAAVAFTGNSRVSAVEFSAHVLREDQGVSLGDVLAAESERDAGAGDERDGLAELLPEPELAVTFERHAFLPSYLQAAAGDPAVFFEECGARYARNAFARRLPEADEASQRGGEAAAATSAGGAAATGSAAAEVGRAEALSGDESAAQGSKRAVWGKDPFYAIAQLPSAALRRDMPECVDAELPEEAREALGARWLHDLRIDSEALHRRQAERLARQLAPATSTTEAIRLVRSRQQVAEDPFVHQACTRVMAALAEGTADADDQNTIIRSYLGEDVFRTALVQAGSTIAAGGIQQAAAELSDATWAAEREGRYVDDVEVVHRNFDNYPSRVLYNLMRTGGFSVQMPDGDPIEGDPAESGLRFGLADRDRKVELVPDSLLHCHMEAAKLLEHSFSGVDGALVHAKRAVELAPTAAAPRCLLARMYMLTGDMASSARMLSDALSLATQPNEIAVAYYQLAYTRWKSGDAQAGAACYVKSIATSPIMATQVAVELQDLLSQESVKIPERDSLDNALCAAGIPLAPTAVVLDAMMDAAKAAVNAGVFAVGRSLLATRLNYQPDDALMGVLRSLMDVRL